MEETRNKSTRIHASILVVCFWSFVVKAMDSSTNIHPWVDNMVSALKETGGKQAVDGEIYL